MKIAYNWLKNHISTDLSVHKISDILTGIGLEVESVTQIGDNPNKLTGVIIGEVQSLEKHPNADKLNIAMVNLGTNNVKQIVCGAPNIAQGQKVPVATIGTKLVGKDGTEFEIKAAKLRGEESFGMICSEVELGVGEDNSGIMVLPNTTQVGQPFTEAFPFPQEDYLIEIGLTPNRADAMSHYGVARDLYAALKTKNIPVTFKAIQKDEFDEVFNNEPNEEESNQNPIQIQVENQALTPRYAGVLLKNVEVKPSPQWLQDYLRTIGLKPTNNVVDVTNYILHDLGQPLHAFDAKTIKGNELVIKTVKSGTKFTTLDNVERTLNGDEIMVCDAEKPLAMAGIYGGSNSGVNENTTDVFLESAYFNPVSIRKSSKYHGLNTDASFRFERGVDPNMTIYALKKAVKLLIEYANVEVVDNIQDVYSTPIKDFAIDLRYHKLDQLLGERIHREQVKQILQLLDITINAEVNETLQVIVPAYRVDVQREVDLIEEILRIYGYNTISTPEKITFSVVQNNQLTKDRLENIVANTLVSLGFNEAMNNSLVKIDYSQTFNWNESSQVNMLNPLSEDLALMRQSLLPGLLENLSFNINRRISNIKLFEFGKTYKKLADNFLEEQKLALLLSGNINDENWNTSSKKVSFYDLKGIVLQILNRLGITQIEEEPIESTQLVESLVIKINKQTVAELGLLHPDLQKKVDIQQPVYFAQLNWNKLLELAQEKRTVYKEVPKFPGSRRDLALLLDNHILYKDLYESTLALDIKILKSIALFDVYEGDKLPAGKKSYALSFDLQDNSKTLSDKEIESTMSKLIHNFKLKFNAELRN